MQDRANQDIARRYREYGIVYVPVNDLSVIYDLADNYINNRAIIITTPEAALGYIQDAVYYLTLEAVESELHPAGSDKRLNMDDRIVRIFGCIAACTYYIKENHPAIIQRSPGIPWRSLSQFTRLSEYHPSFLSNLPYRDRAAIICRAIHSLAVSGELDQLRQVCRNLQDDLAFRQDGSSLPNFLRLYGFLNDEYMVQYIQEGVKNWREQGNFANAAGRVRLLRSIMIIGEALNHASPVVRALFNQDTVQRLIDARNVLCHPERQQEYY